MQAIVQMVIIGKRLKKLKSLFYGLSEDEFHVTLELFWTK